MADFCCYCSYNFPSVMDCFLGLCLHSPPPRFGALSLVTSTACTAFVSWLLFWVAPFNHNVFSIGHAFSRLFLAAFPRPTLARSKNLIPNSISLALTISALWDIQLHHIPPKQPGSYLGGFCEIQELIAVGILIFHFLLCYVLLVRCFMRVPWFPRMTHMVLCWQHPLKSRMACTSSRG